MHAAFTLNTLNDMGPGDFVTALGDIFERAPWVAELAYQRHPFATVTGLHQAMLVGLAAVSMEKVTGFLNSHPDLAGPASREQRLTAASAWEQAIAGLDALTQEDAARLAQWN